ncbi:MAG: hypothetical protein EYC70_03970 [Planctomycetota bacterium]|nr:MAG: hypothetical protein EYC70_03970 [Planctomycetota bacterium]
MPLSYRHPRTGEWAHDVRDPLGEARWVFYAPAAAARPPRSGADLAILEIGFGRGFNTAIALAELGAGARAHGILAVGYEPFPEAAAPWPDCPPSLAASAPWWGQCTGSWELSPGVRVEVRRERAAAGMRARRERFDWIFLDLYSPARHPEDWEPDLFVALAEAARPGAVLTSYCTARTLRAGLQGTGWQVHKRSNPGRRDTLAAVYPL